MRLTKVARYSAFTITAFFVVTAAALFISLSSDSAPLRGDLPSVYGGGGGDAVINDGFVPLGELPEMTPEEITPDPYEDYEAAARMVLDEMTNDEKLYQLFIVTPEALLPNYNHIYAAGEKTRLALEAQPVGGIIYSSQNIVDEAQTRQMLENTQSYTKIPLFLSVDEEGGRVSRVSSNAAMGYEKIPAMAEIGATGDSSQAYETGAYIGEMLSTLGFNLNFAPVADISAKNSAIGDRSFGDDTALVAEMTAALTEGLRSRAVASTLKHFPGIGSAAADTHNGYVDTERTLEELRERELVPFKSGIAAGTDFVMLSHMTAVNVDASGLPSSMSPAIIKLLREELGFHHVIITDALNMSAITDHYSGGEAAVQAIAAGADMLLMPESLTEAFEALKAAIEDGTLTQERIDESVIRILTVKLERGIIGE